MPGSALLLAAACLWLVPSPMSAEVRQATPGVLWLVVERTVDAPPAAVYEAIGQVGRRWDGEHTWSGTRVT